MHQGREWQDFVRIVLDEDGDMNIVLGELEQSKIHIDFGYFRCIKYVEVEGAIRNMRVFKNTGEVGMKWPPESFNVLSGRLEYQKIGGGV